MYNFKYFSFHSYIFLIVSSQLNTRVPVSLAMNGLIPDYHYIIRVCLLVSGHCLIPGNSLVVVTVLSLLEGSCRYRGGPRHLTNPPSQIFTSCFELYNLNFV